MAKRNAGRRGRPRKRRPAAAVSAEVPAAQTAQATRARPQATAMPPRRAHRDPGGVGERPQAPWHPWPFSEILILIGAIATIVAFVRGARAHVLLFAGLGAVVLGTLEFTVREHLSGYRAHTSLIAAVPTALFHGAAAFALYSLGAPRETWVLVPIALDIPIFWLLFRTLRARFQDARRDRVFQLGRR